MDIERVRGVVAEAVKVPAVACNLGGELVYMNPAAEQFCGCSLAEVVGKPCRDLLLDFPLSSATSPSAPPCLTNFESRVRSPNGHDRQAHVSLLPTADATGASGFVMMLEDVHDFPHLLEALRESETRYRTLVESANSLIVKLDAQGRIVFLNDFACRFFGVKEDEALGCSVIGTLVPPEQLSAERLERILRRASDHPDDLRDLEWSCTGPGGRRQWLSLSLRFIHDAQGRMASVLAFGNDITARKEAQESLAQSEEEFRTLFDGASDGIFILSGSGEFREVNQALCRRLGMARTALLGTAPDLHYGAGFAASLQEKVGAVQGDEAVVLEAKETAGDGTVLAVEMSARRLSYHGEPAVLAVARDISERRQAEDAQRLAALGQLSAGVAHEFNNLLAAMMMKAEMASYQRQPEQYEALAEQVVRSCQRGAEICQNLVAFASPLELQRQPLHIEEPIEAALAITLRQMAHADIIVQRDYRSGGRRALADPGQLEQVFLNLFINACHAMPTGGTLEIRTGYEGSGDEQVAVVTVSDTGDGISGELLPRVFEPFFTTKGRLGQSDTPGTGLGLSVSHGIIRAHGGSITVRSEPGRGSRFIVALPVWLEDTGSAQLEAAARGLADSPTGHGCRVLVAEDEVDIANLLAKVLRDRGYEVVTAAETDEALHALQVGRFDLIVTDWLMPGGGGREIVAHAQRLPDSPPIVVVTGKLGLELLEELEPNIVRCLQKPFHLADLLQVIGEVLEQ